MRENINNISFAQLLFSQSFVESKPESVVIMQGQHL